MTDVVQAPVSKATRYSGYTSYSDLDPGLTSASSRRQARSAVSLHALSPIVGVTGNVPMSQLTGTDRAAHPIGAWIGKYLGANGGR